MTRQLVFTVMAPLYSDARGGAHACFQLRKVSMRSMSNRASTPLKADSLVESPRQLMPRVYVPPVTLAEQPPKIGGKPWTSRTTNTCKMSHRSRLLSPCYPCRYAPPSNYLR